MSRHLTCFLVAAVVSGGCTHPLDPPFRAAAPAFAIQAGSARYEIVDLGTLGCCSSFGAQGTNDRGEVFGYGYTSDGAHGFVWKGGVMQDLGFLGRQSAHYTFPHAINARGQIVGRAVLDVDGRTADRAFLWTDSVLRDLGTLGGSSAEALAISDDGRVVGWSQVASGAAHAFVWEDATLTDLGTLGGIESGANDISAAGAVVGFSRVASGVSHAFLWKGGSMQDLGTLGGDAEALRINDRGQVIGNSRTAGGELHAFFWSNGVMRDIGTLPGTHGSRAVAINNRGQVAGNSGSHAFLWSDGVMVSLDTLSGSPDVASVQAMTDGGQIVGYTFNTWTWDTGAWLWEDGAMYDLGALPGGTVAGASGINHCGDIVGWARMPGGEFHAVLWRRSAPAVGSR